MQTIYQRVTQSIIEKLEQGVAPWIRPWRSVADPLPRNLTTQRPYRGINAIMLQLLAQQAGYPSNQWATYRQAVSLGAHVRRGEQGVPVLFYQFQERIEGDEPLVPGWKGKFAPVVRVYTAFNVSQLDGISPQPPVADTPAIPAPTAEAVLVASGASIRRGGDRAFYCPSTDDIQVPLPGAFRTDADYYATALHELVHWTGHSSRCDREFGKRFGDKAYAAEELVAELGSAFLSAHCRLDGQLQHAEYIGHWLALLASDPRAVFVAASKAQQAADFILARTDSADPTALTA